MLINVRNKRVNYYVKKENKLFIETFTVLFYFCSLVISLPSLRKNFSELYMYVSLAAQLSPIRYYKPQVLGTGSLLLSKIVFMSWWSEIKNKFKSGFHTNMSMHFEV